jgi:O-antigen/teichoic acid export membrane protein
MMSQGRGKEAAPVSAGTAADAGHGSTGDLRQKFTVSYVAQVTGQLFGAVTGIVVARLVGPRVMGMLAFGLSYVAVWSPMSDLGLSTSHIKFVSGNHDAAACIGVFARMKVALSLLFVLFMVSLYLVQNRVLNPGSLSPEVSLVIFISIGICLVESLANIPKVTFIARTERAKIDTVFLGQQTLAKSLRVVVAFLGMGAVALSATNLVAGALGAMALWALFRKQRFGGWDTRLARGYVGIALPAVAMDGLSALSENSDRLLLGYLAGTEQVGYYSVVFGISVFLQMVGTTISGIYFPLFSRLIAEARWDEIVLRARQYTEMCNAFLAPPALIAMVGAPTLLPLILGKKYLASCSVMSIVLVGVYFNLLSRMSGSIIVGAGRFWKMARIQLWSFLVLAATEYFLVSPRWLNLGAVGAALAFVAANVTLKVLLQREANEVVGRAIRGDRILPWLVVWGVLNYLMYRAWWSHLPVVAFFAYVPVFFALTYGAMAAAGLVNKERLLMIVSPVAFADALSYVRRELRGKQP